MRSVLPSVVLVSCTIGSAVGLRAQQVDGLDSDGDGWSVAEGDCCDDIGQGCGDEAPLVNPGAFEVDTNGLDDDCDGTIDNPLATDCSIAQKLTALTGADLAQAIDLCQTTVEAPPPQDRRWGVIDAALLRASGTDSDSNLVNSQAAVLMEFGNVWNGPFANATMAALATKTARDTNDPGFVEVVNPPAWNDARVAPLLYENPACSSPSLQAVNSVRLRLRIRVPTNAVGFTFTDTWFNAEFPDTCSPFNDHLLVLLSGLAPGIPPDHNIQLGSAFSPFTVNWSDWDVCTAVGAHTCPLGSSRLISTGFDSPTGAATELYLVEGPVLGGETIVLEILTFNLQDGANNGLVLVDDFQWRLRASGLLFLDGFESQDLSRWSVQVP